MVGGKYRQGIVIGVLFLLSFLLQQVLYFSNDVSWLLEASRRLLHGGNYTQHFFENNPPLILYLYLPAVLIKEIAHIHIMLALQIYVYGLIVLSLYLCQGLCKKIFTDKASYLASPIMYALSVVLLIVISRDFGQREHLLVILTLPYLLLLVARLKGCYIRPTLAVIIGVMAALGFFLKPYFLVGFCALELYYMIKTKNWQSWSRIETRTMLFVLLVYLATVLFRHSDYLTYVMPYSVSWCMASDHLPFAAMINNGLDGFYLCVTLFYLYQRRMMQCKEFGDLVILSALLYLLVYILEATLWTYHLYPFLAFLIIGLVFIFTQRCEHRYRNYDFIAMALFIMATLSILSLYAIPYWTSSVIYPASYILYFSIIFTLYMIMYFYLNKSNGTKIFFTVISIILVTMICIIILDIVNKSEWSTRQFLIVSSTVLALLSFVIAKVCYFKRDHIITFIGAIVVFALPCYMLRSYIERSIGQKHGVGDLIAFMQHEAAHKSVYIFTMELSYAYPVITYGNETTSAARSSEFIGLAGMIIHKQEKSGDGMFLANMVAEDIDKNKPSYILVDNRKEVIGVPYVENNKLKVQTIPFDYLTHFNQNVYFKKAWEHYSFLRQINRYAVYQRIS